MNAVTTDASELTDEQLREITSTSNDAVASLGKPYKWLHSYVAGDKVYCVRIRSGGCVTTCAATTRCAS